MKKFIVLIIYNFLNSFSKISLLESCISTKGNLIFLKSKPIIESADLTGIGLTSQNKALIKGIESNCNEIALLIFPLKKLSIISHTNFGFTFDRTEITPFPPKERIGSI